MRVAGSIEGKALRAAVHPCVRAGTDRMMDQSAGAAVSLTWPAPHAEPAAVAPARVLIVEDRERNHRALQGIRRGATVELILVNHLSARRPAQRATS